MLADDHEFSELVGTLYDAASNPALWQQFLEQLGKATRATSAALILNDSAQRFYAVTAQWRIDPAVTNLYQHYYGSVDIWAERAAAKREGLVCVSESLCPSAELGKTEFYNDLLKRSGIEHAMFALVENTGSRLASVSLYRGPSPGEFLDGEIEVVRSLAPHLRRAFGLHRQFAELRDRSAGFDAALDSLATGVVFLGPEGKVLFMNRSASEMIAERDGLVITNAGRLRAERTAESDQLANAVRSTAQNSSGRTTSSLVLVARRSRPPLQVLVGPIGSPATIGFCAADPISAVAFVTDPARRQRPAEDVLRAMFSLSPAECRVALLLSDGHAARQIADMIGVSENTVRSQIKSIFSKTGVKRQSELIRILLDSSGVAVQRRSG